MKPIDPNFTPEAIAKQVAIFKRKGGQITHIGFGVMRESKQGREYLDEVAKGVFAERETLTTGKVRQNWKERQA